MPVRDVLRKLSSTDITGWMAYEKAFGDIGGIWQMECLAEIHELMQNMIYLQGAQAEKNPVPRPTIKERPLMLQPIEDEEVEQAEPESDAVIPDEFFEEE